MCRIKLIKENVEQNMINKHVEENILNKTH